LVNSMDELDVLRKKFRPPPPHRWLELRRGPYSPSAARRLRPEVSKNASAALSSNEGELARSSPPARRPWPL
jgi:hypothetical protein